MTAEAHPEHVPDLAWTQRPAPFLVPVPAREYAQLTGKRLVIGDPENLCWRYDAVAVSDPRHDREFGMIVEVLDQYDLLRANRTREKVIVARFHLDHLWVERLYEYKSEIPAALLQPPVEVPIGQPHLHEDSLRVDPRRPPVRQTRQGNLLGGHATIGSRLIVNTPTGLQHGYRLISQAHFWKTSEVNLFGGLETIDSPLYVQCYTVCEEEQYFAWASTGDSPTSRQYVQCGQVFFE